MKALIFANGDAEQGVMVDRALYNAEDAQIIAADGGARVAWHYAKQPHIVVGDMDSLSAEEINQLEAEGARLLSYPPEKDETDLELALVYAAEQGATWIRIIGAIGGRFDQMLANVYLLGLAQLENCDLAIVAGNQKISLLYPKLHTIRGNQGDTLSLIPISGDVVGISTQGLQYPLRDEVLRFGPARGISNVIMHEQATVLFQEGLLLCVHTEGKA